MMMQEKIANTDRVPSSRFNIDAYYHQNLDRPGSFNIPGGYFLDDHPEDFDPTFFKLSPVEAMWMDPQQRKLLEVVYEAFDYQQMTLKEPDFRHAYATTGIDPGILGSRVSHVFDLKGPRYLFFTRMSTTTDCVECARKHSLLVFYVCTQ
jgi:acyl transferase domain-containing protein